MSEGKVSSPETVFDMERSPTATYLIKLNSNTKVLKTFKIIKNKKKIYNLLVLILFVATIAAQAPNKMSYQAVIKNASNVLVSNTNIGMRISVLKGTSSGTAVYVESQKATTTTNGLVTLEIGSGALVFKFLGSHKLGNKYSFN